MKHFLRIFCVFSTLLCAFHPANAQSKVGYINFEQLVTLMPESAAASTQLEAYRKSFNDQASTIAADIESKSNILQQSRSTMSDEARMASEQQIQILSQQLQQLQSTAQQSVRAKADELRAPIVAKAKAAIAAAAADGGYTLVLNISENDVIVGSPNDNLLSATKAKLGIQ
ncbi:OmpH family outer membrane protein [Mucilaginibacter sp.]|uniref:OmpH family outer membrane protein n=1 Tax=Mucilaginibacter sp. TaxID=1882438 RepID=UPI003263E632